MAKKEKFSKQAVLSRVKEENIKIIQLWFTDILGILKCVSITSRELKDALDCGKGFDGSSITGFAEAEESDIIAKPDLGTFQVLPWHTENPRIARLFCDIFTPEGNPYPGDPRFALKQTLARAEKMGFRYYIGPELEYFYFKNNKSPELLDNGTYFEVIPNDLANYLRNLSIEMLEKAGIIIESSHHEVAPSQHEIDLKYDDALTIADNIITSRMVIREIAQRNGVYATFMPKPLSGVNGSGMHLHQSLRQGNRNVFFAPNDKYHLSPEAKQFIAGQLTHAREICALTAQWVNSYKRLVSGYEAPVYISWAQKNRTTLIRVPYYQPGNEKAVRAELRCPDPTCNPYLAFSVMLAAGLEGIKKKYKLPEPFEANIYKSKSLELEKKEILPLPGSLLEAIMETEKSKFIKDTLGSHIFNRFILNKKKEWEEYRIEITSHELKKYLPIL